MQIAVFLFQQTEYFSLTSTYFYTSVQKHVRDTRAETAEGGQGGGDGRGFPPVLNALQPLQPDTHHQFSVSSECQHNAGDPARRGENALSTTPKEQEASLDVQI